MKFELEIEVGPGAMMNVTDVASSLVELAERLRQLHRHVPGGKHITGGDIKDVTGAIAGKWKMERKRML